VGTGQSITRYWLTRALHPSAAAIGGPAPPALREHLLVASESERAILRVWFDGRDNPGGSEWLLGDLPGPVTAVAQSRDGVIYAAVGPLLVRIVGE
jgi:hypothetical protein